MTYLMFFQTYKTYFEPLHCLNFSIQSDETQHVLWRVMNGELDEVQAKVCLELCLLIVLKVVVLAVGTRNKHPAPEIFDGIMVILKEIKERQPNANIIVMVSTINYSPGNRYLIPLRLS